MKRGFVFSLYHVIHVRQAGVLQLIAKIPSEAEGSLILLPQKVRRGSGHRYNVGLRILPA